MKKYRTDKMWLMLAPEGFPPMSHHRDVYLASDMDARIAELEKAHARYELIRTLTPREFTKLWQENVAGCGRFDDLVDEAIATGRFKATSSTL